MQKSKYEIDMTNGSIMDKLVSFSLPLMATSILQLMFNAVDIIVVGRFSGSDALAAVGPPRRLSIFLPTCLSESPWEQMYCAPGIMLRGRIRKCQNRYIRPSRSL